MTNQMSGVAVAMCIAIGAAHAQVIQTNASGPNRPAAGPGGFPRAASVPAGVTVQRNIPYVENGHANQVLDLFLPEKPPEGSLPVLIWIHGGAWFAGSQANPPVLHLVQRGFAVASIQYRFSQHAIWPAQANDCKAAVRYLRAHAEKYGLDPERFAAGGDSAGGHLAAILGTSGNAGVLDGGLGVTNVSSQVQAVVDLFGPTDLLVMGQQAGPRSMIRHDAPDSPESRLVGGPVQEKKELARTANPLTYIDANDPPFLILHGGDDQVVPLGQSVLLAKALIDAGVEVTMITVPRAGHGGPAFHDSKHRRVLEEFLMRHLQPAQP